MMDGSVKLIPRGAVKCMCKRCTNCSHEGSGTRLIVLLDGAAGTEQAWMCGACWHELRDVGQVRPRDEGISKVEYSD
jgi:hypothetical protein